MQTLSDNATVIEIKGASYAVEGIDAGECGQSAVRVVKLVNGESYDVVRTHANVVECTCPDFVCRHEGKGSMCKHGRAAVVEGLLPVAKVAPVAEVKPASVRPWGEAERKRAAYFHLNTPKTAPTPVVKPVAPVVLDLATTTTTITTPAGVVAVRTTAMRPADIREAREWLNIHWTVVEANPRDSWPAWTDADRWTTEARDVEPVAVPSPVVTMPALAGPVVTMPELVGLPPALAPMAWVEVGPRAYQMVNLTPIAADYRERNAALERRATRRGPFLPTWEELQEAAEVLADRRSSCLDGEAPPPLGRRSRAPAPRPAWVGVNRMTDADVHPHGVC